MKRNWIQILFALVFGAVLPWSVCAFLGRTVPEKLSTEEIHITVAEEEGTSRRIFVLTETGTLEMALSDYLTGVLLGEMPGDFAMEAKKAQAVVARTYALRVVAGNRHGGAVCTDSGCCQSYRNPEDITDLTTVGEAKEAVKQTEGMVLTYEGKLIDATYFSCSGGMTEPAVAVWGADVPYLQAVQSPGEEYATHYTDTVIFTLNEFAAALQLKVPADPALWVGPAVYTEGGGVETIRIGGKTYQGTDLRKRLGLRSTVFQIEVSENVVTVTTKGFGHRVGMSQYGADAMANAGSDFREILYHYYQGVALEMNW